VPASDVVRCPTCRRVIGEESAGGSHLIKAGDRSWLGITLVATCRDKTCAGVWVHPLIAGAVGAVLGEATGGDPVALTRGLLGLA
jgi:hypothetical protein